ncbi:MAG: hypothetical protein H8D34_26825 [Chloroflexi bacterium]|nr:hypothetical protein [Chloroflexota bacterium]
MQKRQKEEISFLRFRKIGATLMVKRKQAEVGKVFLETIFRYKGKIFIQSHIASTETMIIEKINGENKLFGIEEVLITMPIFFLPLDDI